MNIGSAIKNIRRQVGMTQAELSEKCNISQTSISQIENGVKNPSTRSIKKICGILEVPESVIYILALQESDVPPSRKNIYKMLFPSIRSMALQIVSSDHKHYIEHPDIVLS